MKYWFSKITVTAFFLQNWKIYRLVDFKFCSYLVIHVTKIGPKKGVSYIIGPYTGHFRILHQKLILKKLMKISPSIFPNLLPPSPVSSWTIYTFSARYISHFRAQYLYRNGLFSISQEISNKVVSSFNFWIYFDYSVSLWCFKSNNDIVWLVSRVINSRPSTAVFRNNTGKTVHISLEKQDNTVQIVQKYRTKRLNKGRFKGFYCFVTTLFFSSEKNVKTSIRFIWNYERKIFILHKYNYRKTL